MVQQIPELIIAAGTIFKNSTVIFLTKTILFLQKEFHRQDITVNMAALMALA
jgi:hypothetical protein